MRLKGLRTSSRGAVLLQANQTLYGVTALFMPPAVASSGTITRILPLSELVSTPISIESGILVGRLERYAAQHGDGWREPTFVNTGRISIFLRSLDAMSTQPKFSEYIDVDSATFIRKLGFPAILSLDNGSVSVNCYGKTLGLTLHDRNSISCSIQVSY